MTPEQQKIAIAQACGWKQVTRDNKPEEIWENQKHPLKICAGESKIPDYLYDLNAMHEAEKTLNPMQAAAYAGILTSIARHSFQPVFAPITAKADQRAEAFLRTLGLWEVTE